MSGVSTSVELEAAPSALMIKDGGEQDFIVTRHSQFEIPLNVINWYGDQESHNSKEQIESNWLNILAEVKRIEKVKEGCISRQLGILISMLGILSLVKSPRYHLVENY